MPPTDISERGLESLIVRHMTGEDGMRVPPFGYEAPASVTVQEKPQTAGTGYMAGCPQDFEKIRSSHHCGLLLGTSNPRRSPSQEFRCWCWC